MLTSCLVARDAFSCESPPILALFLILEQQYNNKMLKTAKAGESLPQKGTRRSPRFPKPTELSSVAAQQIMRLRVNRVAIIQHLNVEHILWYLKANDVITDREEKAILQGSSQQERTMRLIDLLPLKGSKCDWYDQFRTSLQKADADKETKQRYYTLIQFLDNTIIRKPRKPNEAAAPSGKTSATTSSNSMSIITPVSDADGKVDDMKLPKYEPLPSIDNTAAKDETDNVKPEKGTDEAPENLDKDTEEPSMKLIIGYVHQWVPSVPNFKTQLQEPAELYEKLEMSTDSHDKLQLTEEKSVLNKMKELEITFVMHKMDMLPKGFVLCMASAVQDILEDKDNYHLYMKYFTSLKNRHNKNLIKELCGSFIPLTQTSGSATQADHIDLFRKTGFCLFELAEEFGEVHVAEDVMKALIRYLGTNLGIETWRSAYEAYVRLMFIRNVNYNFKDADLAYHSAQQYLYGIDLMSFGQKGMVDEPEREIALSTMKREEGSHGSAYSWAQSALQKADKSNCQNIVRALCNATLAYMCKMSVKRAKQLAVAAVQQARELFGANHPMYLEALLTYVTFSNEYLQNQEGVEVALKLLEKTEKVYGCDTVLLAKAHHAVSRALVAAKNFTDEMYLDHADKALRTAMDCVPSQHPILAVFRRNLAECLLVKSQLCDDAQKDGLLIYAESEVSHTLNAYRQQYGEISWRTGEIMLLEAELHAKMGRLEEAEEQFRNVQQIFDLCLAHRSHYKLIAKGKFAEFYKQTERPAEAVAMFKEIIKLETGGVYIRWIDKAYDNLIELYKETDELEQEQEVEKAQYNWMVQNPEEDSSTWEELNEQPKPFAEFIDEFQVWQKKLRKFKFKQDE